MKSLSVAVSLLALCAAVPAGAADLAQNQPAPRQTAPGGPGAVQGQRSLSPADVQFLDQVAVDGRAEVEMGRLAMQKAQEPAVREFGRWMMTDHSMIDDTLTRIAARSGVQLSPGLDSRHQAELQQLQRLSGPQFDQRYIAAQVQGHRQTVAAFQQQAQNGSDLLLKTVAGNALPMLEQHLAQAEELARLPAVASGRSSMGSGSSAPSAGGAGSRTR